MNGRSRDSERVINVKQYTGVIVLAVCAITLIYGLFAS